MHKSFVESAALNFCFKGPLVSIAHSVGVALPYWWITPRERSFVWATLEQILGGDR